LEKGSSRRISDGAGASARATATRCCWASRKLVRIAVGEVGQVDQIEHARNTPAPLLPARALEPEADVLRRREVGRERVVLEDDTDAPRLGLHVDSALGVRHGPPGDRDPPLVRRLEPGDQPKRRRLATSRGPQQGEDAAAPDGER
jgi:hypothetical protein